ncbi:MAG TPA: DEAD/DEAH box helicase family protein [Bacillota bacterium]|nr:DEAD/DEAH box helicase family protein [Bacillota bacterium]
MKDFTHCGFKGTFRDYQTRILEQADHYLADGRLNIVAAPGSGKTTLGLEMIRRIGKPCIVLSPTTTIKYQWGSRFSDAFLSDTENPNDYVSYDLHEIKLINSITYQALYSAMKKIQYKDDEEETEKVVDYSDIDLFKLMKEYGIGLVCLDEAHHLQNEWQKALEEFITGLNVDISVISLTATPPYDASITEWERYIKVCGEIDEEIFVPELVSEGALCPHQDYVYFNYPTEEEAGAFTDYRKNAFAALEALRQTTIVTDAYQQLCARKEDYDFLYSRVKPIVSFLVLCQFMGIDVHPRFIKKLTTLKHLPKFSLAYAQEAVLFLQSEDSGLQIEQIDEVTQIMKSFSLVEKGKVSLTLNAKLKKHLASSCGKLKSIAEIAGSEEANLGEKLRMLVLTDFIKKETVSDIGTNQSFSEVSVVSVFETLRRTTLSAPMGVLSGSLVILPTVLAADADIRKATEIAGTDYSIIDYSCSNKQKVEKVTALFQSGKIKLLIGTKSLLGEGWDSPCINTLILASFVGSFMLSNQMRGRAIRKDVNQPDKVSSIWHLVSVEPEYFFADNQIEGMAQRMNQDDKTLVSDDYDTLIRRFDCFVGPNYDTGEVESGIERITAICPPYNKNGIARINQKMLALSANRKDIDSKWTSAIRNSARLQTEVAVPKEYTMPGFIFIDYIVFLALIFGEIFFAQLISTSFRAMMNGNNYSIEGLILYIIIAIAAACGVVIGTRRILMLSSPHRAMKAMGKALLKTLQERELISTSVSMLAQEDNSKVMLGMMLSNASVHEQNIFAQALTEMFSMIDNPRYIIVMKHFGLLSYRHSYACPSIIAARKEYVELFQKNLHRKLSDFAIFYTRNESGREMILKCRKRAYISFNTRLISRKKRITPWD